MRLSAIEKVVWGDEPKNIIITHINSPVLRSAMNWYNNIYDIDKGKLWISQWMQKNNYSARDIQLFNKNCKYISSSFASPCRMMNNGIDIPEELFNRLRVQLDVLIIPFKVEPPAFKVDKQWEKTSNTICKIEEILDSFYNSNYQYTKPDVYGILLSDGTSPNQAKLILTYYNDILNHLKLHSNEEEFSRLKKKQVKNYTLFLEDICSDISKHTKNPSIVKKKKPRTLKAKSASTLVKNIKYKKSDDILKITSLDPVGIIKASSVLLFNTKYKRLSLLEASDFSGLSVKGTSIINFCEHTSISKTIRKPDLILHDLLKGTKSNLTKNIDSITSKSRVPTGRISVDVVILRIIN